MDKREFKNKAYNELAKITKALGNPRRMEIIDLLAQGPFSVEKIAEQTNLSVANASQHLQVLKGARLVEISKKGNFIYYQLTNDKVFQAWRALRELGLDLNAEAEKLVNDFYRSGEKMKPVTIEELRQKISGQNVVILDVRPGEEYQRGHIKEAASIPIEDLAERIDELPKGVEIIAYCRGPLCVYADEAVSLLREKGFDARRLKEGFPDWKAMGFPAEIN
ncbi:ArsR/SmtB family transcription factor [Salegentibacter flavus]|uniref:Transcriptional regulator, ArsR family n=1 Tax=Salegentibacter flavus TaxID=287099 RepID=A0A1I5CJF6_9FLAO|nr:metalloregulator ArsR/SmtB family transcription factor [Salegentibacter flavus]SFN87037.1 transcriptional regulator, ArsR family [Salegentibacter flavus]